MKNLEIKVPIEENAIVSISFQDSEGIYIMHTKDTAIELINEIKYLIKGCHTCTPLQRLFSLNGLSSVQLDILELHPDILQITSKLKYYKNLYKEELLNPLEGRVSKEVKASDYIDKSNKILKVNKTSAEKTEEDILGSYQSVSKANLANLRVIRRDINSQVYSNTTHYKNLPYYFCLRSNLQEPEPLYVESNFMTPILEKSDTKDIIHKSIAEACRELGIDRISASRRFKKYGSFVKKGVILSKLYLINY